MSLSKCAFFIFFFKFSYNFVDFCLDYEHLCWKSNLISLSFSVPVGVVILVSITGKKIFVINLGLGQKLALTDVLLYLVWKQD